MLVVIGSLVSRSSLRGLFTVLRHNKCAYEIASSLFRDAFRRGRGPKFAHFHQSRRTKVSLGVCNGRSSKSMIGKGCQYQLDHKNC
jgi:hypothetical protein